MKPPDVMNVNNLKLDRRNFIKTSAGAGLFIATAAYGSSLTGCASERPVRLGFVGVGGRGMGMLKVALSLEGVEITAVCDIVPEKVERAQSLVEAAGQPKPLGFTGPEDYKKLAELNNLDAVYTATPTNLHTPIMLAAMRAGKYGGTEMPACTEYDQAWELVEASEKSGKPCMLMENYAYMRNVKMVLVMSQLGMFGDLTHCECGYQHDARYAGFGPKGEMLWRALGGQVNSNAYPTHAIGPVAQWLNINRGNRFEYLVSMSSRAVGQNYYAAKKFGADHPAATMKYAQGDVNTTLIQTHNGITITLYYDTKNPRPPDWIYRIQGTKGIYSGTLNKIYLEDLSPKPHQWEDIEQYQEKYDHPLWKKYGSIANSSGHGGGDYLCFRDFVQAIRNGTDTPIDVYDTVTWSIITKLTAESVSGKSRPVDFPDYTKGKWETRKPDLIING
ncbi:MAG TPA: glycosyl hydrolase [Bacteroidales bacterium]|nr:glycosyl hydrolase [Bacteroidales bacterium]HBQ84136.1 glycosyl hydrolase [Bacteroidales bacterium]HCU17700.1 glycosyl hydrolase [Bacteroidales bacterium]